MNLEGILLSKKKTAKKDSIVGLYLHACTEIENGMVVSVAPWLGGEKMECSLWWGQFYFSEMNKVLEIVSTVWMHRKL